MEELPYFSYLELIPEDIILQIVTKLEFNTLVTSYLFLPYQSYKKLQEDSTYNILIKHRNPKFYDYIPTVKNIDGKVSWKLLYNFIDFVEIHYPDIEAFFGPDDGSSYMRYLLDIYFSWKISISFPLFWNEVKMINLEHHGMGKRYFLTWEDIYKYLNTYKAYDFIKGKFDLISYKTFTYSNFKNVRDEPIVLFFKLIIYIYIMRNASAVGILAIYNFFTINYDMYENLIRIVNIKSILNRGSEIMNLLSILAPPEKNPFTCLMKDLRSRI